MVRWNVATKIVKKKYDEQSLCPYRDDIMKGPRKARVLNDPVLTEIWFYLPSASISSSA